MGVGDPLEAAIAIESPLPPGSWHLVGDGIVFAGVDVQFDVLRRRPASDDVPIVRFVHHFDRPASGFSAVPYEDTAAGPAVDVQQGDRLVLRFTVLDPGTGVMYVPNGDGAYAQGRIPSLELPR